MSCSISPELIDKVIAFHGHSCPGLVIGIRAAELALKTLGGPEGKDIVAVSETDMCGVDAIQFLTGCTYGKGNLIHRDYGKMAFSFHDRKSGKGFRALLRTGTDGGIRGELHALMKLEKDGANGEDREAKIADLRRRLQAFYMEADLDTLFEVTPTSGRAPRSARVLDSLRCEDCGEMTMESRTRRYAGKTLCIPCFERVEQKV